MGVEPKELHRGEESWELVVEKLVRVGPNYYKPRRQRVRGRADILQALHRLERPALAEDAKRAMEGPPQAYQVTDGRLEAFDGADEPRSGSHDETHRLARRCAHLESRVEALEAALRTSRHKRRSAPSSPMAERPSDGRGPEAPLPPPSNGEAPARKAVPPSARPQQRDVDTPQDSGGAPSEAASEATPSGTKPGEATPSEAPARLTFPQPVAIGAAYANLLGSEMVMTDIPSFALDEGRFYMTDLLDESEEVVGALVLDLRATVFQAGALTMLDEDARQAMFESGEPSADTLDAMKELLGAQSRCFNAIPGNPHVHMNSLRPPDAALDAWVYNPVQSMGLRDPFEGRVLLLSR